MRLRASSKGMRSSSFFCSGDFLDMPNPLSKVHSTEKLSFDDNAAVQRPLLAAQVAKILGAIAKVDSAMGNIFCKLMGDESEKGAAIYNALIGINAQDAALDAAANQVLSRDDMDLLMAVKGLTKRPRDQRNQMAHGLWGWSVDMPEAILLMSPRHLTSFVERIDRYIASHKPPGAMPLPPPEIDRTQIFVYTQADFDALHKQISAAHDAWNNFMWAVFGVWPGLNRTAAEARRQLFANPEILGRVNKARENRQEPPLPPPPTQPATPPPK